MFVTLSLSSCFAFDKTLLPTPMIGQPPPIQRSVNNLIGLNQIWVLNDIYILWNRFDSAIDAFNGKSCFLGSYGENKSYGYIICLNTENGGIFWYTKSDVHRSIEITQDNVFVSYSSSATLKKYSVETGNLVWTKQLDGTGSIYLYYVDNQIQVSTTSQTLWVLDENGELIREVEGDRIFISTNEENYINLDGLQVVDTNTQVKKWEERGLSYLTLAPIFTEDKIFLRDGDNFSGTAYALSRQNGVVLWRNNKIVSNLVYSPEKNTIYAINEGGDLLAINEESGKATKVAEFIPEPLIFYYKGEAFHYQLAYDDKDNILIVYLGDSKQLFAFKEN